jgi:hypothetical protein
MSKRTIVEALCLAAICLALLPAAAHAQSSIAGSVKDTTGAVLPGVTVEAASPALIEKTRSVVTVSRAAGAHRPDWAECEVVKGLCLRG